MGKSSLDVRVAIDQVKEAGIKALPNEVRQAILAAISHDVFSVTSSSQPITDTVLRTRVLSFGPGAQLRFASTSAEFVAVFAQEIKFSEIPTRTTLGFVDVPVPHAKHRPPAANGADGNGYRSNNKGKPGGPGQPGANGEDGGTLQLPAVYLLTNNISAPPNPEKLPYITFKLGGIAGGNGGNGGKGGKGGDGHDGRNSRDRLVPPPPRCVRQAASGGRGGDGAPGGKPGNAGNGGDGADLWLYAPATVVDLLEFSVFENEGGAGSNLPGESGLSGEGGEGGDKGRRRGICERVPVPDGSWEDGDDGATPRRTQPLRGSVGNKGAKGDVTAVEVPDINDLLI